MSQDASSNPYQSPQEKSLGLGGAAPSQRTTQLLMETRPWVKLMGVLGMISVVFMVLGALGMVIAAVSGGQLQFMGLAVLYILMAVLYYFPIRYLLQYASRIQDFVRDGTTEHLDQALESQKSFWKFIGILTAIIMGFYAVGLLLFLIASVVGSVS